MHQTQTTRFISSEFFQRLTCQQQDSNSIEETSYEDATREQRLPVMMKDTPTCVPVLKEPRVGFDGDEAQPVSQHFILDNRCIIVNENLLYSHGWHLEGKREEFRCGKTRAKPTERPTDPSPKLGSSRHALTSASKILLKALAMAASIPTMSNSMLSSLVCTTSIRKF